jgi:cell division protein FtsI/penicillin-binding protein 2
VSRVPTPRGALATVALIASLLAGCSGEEDDARQLLDQFLAGWRSGELAEVPFVDPHGAPLPSADAAAELTSLSGELAGRPPELTVAEVVDSDGLAVADVQVDWPLPGGATWHYGTVVRLQDTDGGWRVIWAPEVVHPDLAPGDELLLSREPAARGEIVDGSGKTIMGMRPVKDIGIWPSRVSDADALVADLRVAFDTLGIDLDETLAALPDRIEEAQADDLRVPVVTLRADDYEQVSGLLGGREEILVEDDEWYLAPSRTFARALIGTVGDVTAEIMEEDPGVYEEGDPAGLGGLSRRYDERLRGIPGQRVVAGDEELELTSIPAEPGSDLPLTLDIATQRAAEAALSADSRPAALVAVRISDGAVLAVANTEGKAANPVNTALTGAVPPGSVFKAVSAYRLLDTGEVSLDEPVGCPAEYEAGGFPVTNAFGGDRGRIPFRRAVAISCNTAFAALAPRLGGDGLATAAAALGIGGDWDLGTDTFTGSVATGGSAFDQAQAAFGQGETLVSPAAMAAATAALARGAWLPPTLVVDPEAAAPDPTPLNESAAADVRSALRAVVTGGTASALADTPGGDVFGKTGSAEAGEDVTHAWFAGWQGDLAFAIFIESGESGSGGAVPLADDFLRRLG